MSDLKEYISKLVKTYEFGQIVNDPVFIEFLKDVLDSTETPEVKVVPH